MSMANFLAKFLWKLWGWHLFYMEKYKEKKSSVRLLRIKVWSYIVIGLANIFFVFFFFCLIKFAQTRWVWLDSCDWIKNVGRYRIFIYVGDVPSHVLCFWTNILMHNLYFWWLSSFIRGSHICFLFYFHYFAW